METDNMGECDICGGVSQYEVKFFNTDTEKHLVFSPTICKGCFKEFKDKLKSKIKLKPAKTPKAQKTAKPKSIDEAFQRIAREDKFDIKDFKQDSEKIMDKMAKAARSSRKGKDINAAILKRAQSGVIDENCRHKNKIKTDAKKGYEICQDCGSNLIGGKPVG